MASEYIEEKKERWVFRGENSRKKEKHDVAQKKASSNWWEVNRVHNHLPSGSSGRFGKRNSVLKEGAGKGGSL